MVPRISPVPTALLLFIGLFGGLSAAWGLEYSRNLSLYACEHTVVATVHEAWSGAEDLVYALVPRGAPQPAADHYDGIISVPVRRVVSMATSNIPHLTDLGGAHTIAAVDNGAYIFDEAIRQRVQTGEILQVGSGGTTNLERIIALDPDVVLITLFGPDDPLQQQLQQAGIPALVVADWREATPLGRGEWIKLFAALLGRTSQGDQLFQERRDRYVELRDSVARALHEGALQAPRIVANAPWQGQWPVPGGDSFMARLFADAGGDYIWQNTGGAGSVFLDFEAVVSRGLEADVWLHLNVDWFSREDIRRADPRLTAFAPFQNNRIFHYTRRIRQSGANDFWERGLAEPDKILADLVWILHGPETAGIDELYFYNHIQ
jgi:iron complex transport system substrate-binding protein